VEHRRSIRGKPAAFQAVKNNTLVDTKGLARRGQIRLNRAKYRIKELSMRRLAISFLFLAIFVGSVFGQSRSPLRTMSDLNRFEADFLGLFADGSFEAAYEIFRGEGSGLGAGEVDSLESATLEQISAIEDSWGETQDYVRIDRQDLQGALLRSRYIVRYEFYALQAIFTFYNNGEEWNLVNFSWNDRITELFD
jgi:hypothetical protein